jgi:hypothetical protein
VGWDGPNPGSRDETVLSIFLVEEMTLSLFSVCYEGREKETAGHRLVLASVKMDSRVSLFTPFFFVCQEQHTESDRGSQRRGHRADRGVRAGWPRDGEAGVWAGQLQGTPAFGWDREAGVWTASCPSVCI